MYGYIIVSKCSTVTFSKLSSSFNSLFKPVKPSSPASTWPPGIAKVLLLRAVACSNKYLLLF